MPAPSFLGKLPKPILFGLYGAVGGLVGALVFGELVWYLLRPPPPVVPPEPPPPPPQLALTASPHVSLYTTGKNTFAVQIARDRFDGPIVVKFDRSTPGLTAAEVTIPKGEMSATAEVAAAANAKPGVHKLTATATASPDGHALSATATIQVTVMALPPPPPRLAVSVSPRIQVYQKGKNTFAVQVARDRFDGEVKVAFDNLPEGVSVPPVTFPPGKTEATVDLTADATAKPGLQEVTVRARAEPPGQPLHASVATGVQVLPPPKAPVDIVFALDVSGSMQWAINGTSKGIQRFADELGRQQLDVRVGLVGFQDTTLKQPLKVLKFDGEKLTSDFKRFRDEVAELRAGGGGLQGESSLDGVAEAADYTFRDQVTKVVILITDEEPKERDGRMAGVKETAEYLKQKKIDQLHIVTPSELKKEFEPLWEGAKGKYFDLKAVAEGKDGFDKLLPDLSKAIADLVADRPAGKPELPAVPPPAALPPATAAGVAVTPAQEAPPPKIDPPVVKSLQSGEQSAAGTESWLVARSGVWTGVIAALVCLALLAGQKSYLQGKLPPVGGVLVALGGGLLVGVVGGAAGQGLFLLANTENVWLLGAFRVLGWALLGGLAGAGLALFIPNLGVLPGLAGGVVGGAVGALGFLAVSGALGALDVPSAVADPLGRLAGGLVLGLCIGLMVAAAEAAFRRAWLEVRYGERETIAVTLGAEPVKVGGDSRACTVWARGAAPVALRFFVRDGEVLCEDAVSRSESAVGDGFSRTVGPVTVVVRTGDGAPPPPPAPRKPAPARKRADDWDPLPVAAPKPGRPMPAAQQVPLELDDEPMPLPLPSSPPPAKPTSDPRPVVAPPVPARSKPPVPAAPARPAAPAVPHKPNISAAPKPGEACPKCGRKVPGEPGKRYCMLCDVTF